jgi:hypothetical protein
MSYMRKFFLLPTCSLSLTVDPMPLVSSRHVIGLLCCLVALAACIAACFVARSRSRQVPPGWPVLVSLTVLQFALLVDMLFSLRWLLHNELASEFMAHHLYERRVGPQHLALVLVAAAALIGIWFLVKSLRGRRGAQLASCGMILWIATWFTEVISLHAMDVFLHKSVAHVNLRDVLWIVSTILISYGVLLDVRRAPTTTTQRAIQAAGEENVQRAPSLE